MKLIIQITIIRLLIIRNIFLDILVASWNNKRFISLKELEEIKRGN